MGKLVSFNEFDDKAEVGKVFIHLHIYVLLERE